MLALPWKLWYLIEITPLCFNISSLKADKIVLLRIIVIILWFRLNNNIYNICDVLHVALFSFVSINIYYVDYWKQLLKNITL